jgi:hypothetical protein
MVRKGAQAAEPGRSSAGRSVKSSRPLKLPAAKTTVLALIIGVLLGAVAFAVLRETLIPRRPVAASTARPIAPPRPAFTPAEEAYIRALWPIHGDVERSAARMILGQIFYKTKDLDRPALQGRIADALVTYQRSEKRLRALTPPASVARDHQEYLAAIQLFQQSAVEVMKMFEDGREDHMVAAYPLGQQATDKIREVGGKFWPHEFPPN